LKKLYILRHGETDFNKNGMVQGSGINSSLNETGRAQSEAFYQAYQHIDFDKIYVSELIRTRETVDKFILRGIVTQALVGLNEISWGVQEGLAFTPESSTVYQQTCDAWSNGDLEARIEGGETPAEVATRQRMAMDHILASEGSTILISTHGRAIRILLCTLLGYPLQMMTNFGHNNTGVYVLNCIGSVFSIETFNDTSHLGKI
jgi:probable phosphoglycerate mutase